MALARQDTQRRQIQCVCACVCYASYPIEDIDVNEGHFDRRDSSEETSWGNLPAHTTCLSDACCRPSAFLSGLQFQSLTLIGGACLCVPVCVRVACSVQ